MCHASEVLKLDNPDTTVRAVVSERDATTPASQGFSCAIFVVQKRKQFWTREFCMLLR